MADRIREIQSKLLKNLHGGDQLAAALGYIPIFGWIFPYYFKKDDDFAQFHGKQALHLNIVLFGVYFVIWVLENFPLTSWVFGEGSFLHAISHSAWLITAFGYLALCIVGAFKAMSEEKWRIPYLSEYVERFIDQVKSK